MDGRIDLGSGYSARWFPWSPDRSIPANAERYEGVADIEHCLLSIDCPHGDAGGGGLHPDTPEVRAIFPDGPHWTLVSEDPLHLEPSILMRACGCHGYIRGGKWEPA